MSFDAVRKFETMERWEIRTRTLYNIRALGQPMYPANGWGTREGFDQSRTGVVERGE
jgi:hypothetical protein